jgi:TM2 domain-containing membrane protein YozV
MHAWDCRCGERNAPVFTRCRKCGGPMSAGRIIQGDPQPKESYIKPCPRCKLAARLDATTCLRCGYTYRPPSTPPHQAPPPKTPAATKACPTCQRTLSAAASQCPQCGHPFRVCPICRTPLSAQTQQCPQCLHCFHPMGGLIQRPAGRSSPWVAIGLSLLCSGAGQMYNGQWAKGVVVLLATILAALVLGCLGAFLLYILAISDAFAIAERLNRGEPIAAWSWFR